MHHVSRLLRPIVVCRLQQKRGGTLQFENLLHECYDLIADDFDPLVAQVAFGLSEAVERVRECNAKAVTLADAFEHIAAVNPVVMMPLVEAIRTDDILGRLLTIRTRYTQVILEEMAMVLEDTDFNKGSQMTRHTT